MTTDKEAEAVVLEPCPICGDAFKADDICATDIEEGTCHSACLEGSPVVDLETGEPSDGPILTFRYADSLAKADLGPAFRSILNGLADNPALARLTPQERMGFGLDLGKQLAQALSALRPQAGDREEVARVISSNPAYLAEVRDEQQTWLAGHLADAVQALYRSKAK